jgi:hypothetical protein
MSEEYTVASLLSMAQQEIAYYNLPIKAYADDEGNFRVEPLYSDMEVEDYRKIIASLFEKLTTYCQFGIKVLEFGNNTPSVDPGPVEGKGAKVIPFLRLVK